MGWSCCCVLTLFAGMHFEPHVGVFEPAHICRVMCIKCAALVHNIVCKGVIYLSVTLISMFGHGTFRGSLYTQVPPIGHCSYAAKASIHVSLGCTLPDRYVLCLVSYAHTQRRLCRPTARAIALRGVAPAMLTHTAHAAPWPPGSAIPNSSSGGTRAFIAANDLHNDGIVRLRQLHNITLHPQSLCFICCIHCKHD